MKERLQPMVEDKLVQIDDNKITITRGGRPFVRNICAAFDARLHATKSTDNVFSKAI